MTLENRPATQSMQADAALAPTILEYVPATQLRQVVAREAADVVENEPAAQLIQASLTVAPTLVEYLPAGQLEHVDTPAILEYVPAAQFKHVLLVEAPELDE